MNKVELLGWYGGDLSHAMSAWTSTSRQLTEDKKKRINKLVKMLAENGHETPFEKSYLHFLVTCDTASHIHILKHRVLSVNGESARYKELKDDKYYVPDDWPVWAQNLLDEHMEQSYRKYHWVLETLEKDGISRKRAKESARFFLPYANQLTLDVGMNFRAFIGFQRLRNKDDAQLEIHEIADEMLNLVRNIEGNPFKHSLEAFGYE